MATMNVSLPDPMKAWVEAQVETGHFSNASDYVRDLIRRDQQDQAHREALVQALVAGETSGISSRDIAEIWNDVKARHRVDD
jgi:antitoxin ParD1/3/4